MKLKCNNKNCQSTVFRYVCEFYFDEEGLSEPGTAKLDGPVEDFDWECVECDKGIGIQVLTKEDLLKLTKDRLADMILELQGGEE